MQLLNCNSREQALHSFTVVFSTVWIVASIELKQGE